LRKMEARLVNLLRTTIDELDELWRSIGLSAKERTEQVETLFRETQDLCKNRIATEQALAVSYREQVQKLKEDIAICADRLDLVRQPIKPTNETLSLVRELTNLRGDYEELDKKRTEMERVMMEKLNMLHRCWDEMKMKYEQGFESIGFKLSSKRMNEISFKYEEVRKAKDQRQAVVHSKAQEAAELMELLEMDDKPTDSFDHAILTRNEDALGLSASAVEALDQRISELKAEKQSREAELMRLGNLIQPLWERLGVTKPERESFFKRHGTLGEKSVKACEAELDRLRDLRKRKINEFIEHVRDELRVAMDEARVMQTEKSRLQRLMCEPVNPEDYEACEQLLNRHEQELEKLKMVVEAIRPVVKACQKYLALCRERNEYEVLIQDSSRLLNRKRGALSLQEEEKMRKRVQDLPKNIAQLKHMVDEFEKNYLRGDKLILSDILGEDQPVVMVIDKSEKEHDERVQREKEQRNNKKHEQEKPSSVQTVKKVAPAVSSTVTRVPLSTVNKAKI
jgi:hypothetical protein